MSGIKITLSSCLFICLFALTSSAFADYYKCFAMDDSHKQHIVLIDTSDLEDAKRAALASTVKVSGKSRSMSKVYECKAEADLFTSARARQLDKSMPR